MFIAVFVFYFFRSIDFFNCEKYCFIAVKYFEVYRNSKYNESNFSNSIVQIIYEGGNFMLR